MDMFEIFFLKYNLIKYTSKKFLTVHIHMLRTKIIYIFFFVNLTNPYKYVVHVRLINSPECPIRFGQIVYFATILISVSQRIFFPPLNYCDSIYHYVVSANRAFFSLEMAIYVVSCLGVLRRLGPFRRLKKI